MAGVDSRCLVLSSFLVGVAQPTGWQGTTSSTKRKENDPTATINNNRDPILVSFLCRRCSTHWMAGNNIVYKRTKREQSDATINNNRDPILFSFLCRRRSTRWMAGNNIVYSRAKKESNPTRQSTTGAIPQRPSTRTIRHCQEKEITNCVLLLSNWSKCILRRNSLEYIPNCECEIHVLQKRENANPATLLCILQWKAIPGLTWDLNAEMLNEKSISSKCS
jgi:hypothetical protein